MITAKQIAGLKRANASVDSEKTKVRITEDFKATSKADRDAILSLSGLSRSAFYRVATAGNASPKVVLSLAQVLNVSPYYYTGEIDEKEDASETSMKEFLKKYTNKNSNAKPKKSATNRKNILQQEEVPAEITEPVDSNDVESTKPLEAVVVEERKFLPEAKSTTAISMDFDNSPKMNKAVKELSEESAVLLLKALMERAKAGGNAETLCDIVKRCLLS